MALTQDQLIIGIKKIVSAHYQNSSAPLLLSDLGAVLHNGDMWNSTNSDGKKLRQIIEDANDPDLLIVRDPDSPAYIAVSTQASKAVIEQFVEHRRRASSVIPDLSALPRPILLAFCLRKDEGKNVFVRKSPPFKYEIDVPPESQSQYFMVDDRYRRPGLNINDVSELNVSDRLDLQTRIASWSKDNGIQLEDFYVRRKKLTNALERLLAAQSPGMAQKIVIPGDIALILSQHE
jgi:hypothetical protein